MKILLLTPTTAGLASSHLVHYLDRQDWEEYRQIRHPVAPTPPGVGRFSILGGIKLRREPFHLSPFTYGIDVGLTVAAARGLGKFDYAICINTHLALSALMLKKMGVVKKVVYWALDYYPVRYGNEGAVKGVPGLEKLFRGLEKYVVKHSDVLWTITPNMPKGWAKGGYKWKAPVRTVPHCVSEIDEPRWPRKDIIWSGNLQRGKEFGFDTLIEAWRIVKRSRPGLGLTVTSRTPTDTKYKGFLARSDVNHLGFVQSTEDFREIVGSHLAGVSPYAPNSYKEYSDVSAAKLFASCGIPVLISETPYTARVVKEEKAGIVFQGNAEDLARAILEATESADYNQMLAGNAHNLAKRYLASEIFPIELAFLELFL
jgi:glycosyltransferase involved in cell wall biosynthesis